MSGLAFPSINIIPPTTYSPSISNAPTGTVTARYWRIAGFLWISGEIATITGAGTASIMSIPIPAGFTLSASFLVDGVSPVGVVKFFKSGTGPFCGVSVYSSTGPAITLVTPANGSNSMLGSNFANGDGLGWMASFPLLGG